MKHIKLYEGRKIRTMINKFKVDDYVIASNIANKFNDEDFNSFLKKRICIINYIDNSNRKYSVVQVIYKKLDNKYFPPNNDYSEYYWMYDEKELRLATPVELEQYKIELNSNKYNL